MEEIKKIEVQGTQYGVADMMLRRVFGGNAQTITWDHTSNMNDYKDVGTYRIKGERTGNPLSDNLPIMNQGSGHTIEGILYVLDSSLTNGSGNSDDCTITQFLMLSNRVGGQEGDTYMRSAYGPNKDSLTWKPWEKYQTNMEVGAVSDYKLLNPSNPTQVLKQEAGMSYLTENGIYSGVYVGPKAMIGTADDEYTMIFNDPAGIETFVMVVINNYAAASNARCITQIKFAVTNGGVFSMEKRSTTPGGIIPLFSQWESIGGGGGSGLPKSWVVGDDVTIGTSGAGSNVTIGPGVFISSSMNIKPSIEENFYTLGTDSTEKFNIKLGRQSYIGNNVTILQGICLFTGSAGDYVSINCDDIPFKTDTKFFGEDNQIGCTDTSYEGLSKRIGGVKIGCNVVIPDNLSFSITDNQLTIKDDKQINIQFGGEGLGSLDCIEIGEGSALGKSSRIGRNVSISDNLKFSIADNILTITDGTKTWKLTAE